MTHVHDYRLPTPRGYEEGDAEPRCSCGERQRRVVLPYVPKSPNRLIRLHYQQVATARRRIRDDMALLLIDAEAKPYERAIVTLDFRWRTRHRRDLDNAVAGCKAVVDALVGIWITDDDTEHMQLRVTGTTGTGRPDCVVITVEEES